MINSFQSFYCFHAIVLQPILDGFLSLFSMFFLSKLISCFSHLSTSITFLSKICNYFHLGGNSRFLSNFHEYTLKMTSCHVT